MFLSSVNYLNARVVELVDTMDLKSIGHCGRAGSSPAPGTNYADDYYCGIIIY